MKKERCFYLDFIRALAVVVILMTHYNANYIYMGSEDALAKAVLSTKIANIYIGDFGVSLFLIISGAALMYTYSEKLELKTFYHKRFLSIYPMFWLGYFICFSHSFIQSGTLNHAAPRWSILLTFFGMDGYLGTIMPTFYLIGEWFLGFIILTYIIFPILRKGVKDYPIVTAVLVSAVYIFFTVNYRIPFIKNIFLLIRLPEIVFGMYFVKYIKKPNWQTALVGAVVLVANTLLKPTIDTSVQMTYVGISAFFLFAYISKWFEKEIIVTRICQILSKYSYAIFLTHHYIITYFATKVNMSQLSIIESYILFLIECCVIGLFSKLLYMLNDYVIAKFRKYYRLEKERLSLAGAEKKERA